VEQLFLDSRFYRDLQFFPARFKLSSKGLAIMNPGTRADENFRNLKFKTLRCGCDLHHC
jgi:hypothetical protein